MRVVGIVQARMSSSRLPGKSVRELAGRPLILRVLERVARASLLDDLWLATSVHASDDPLATVAVQAGYRVHRGELDDVLARVHGAAERAQADVVVRLTGDCPLHDGGVIDQAVAFMCAHGDVFDFVSNALEPTYPDGLDTEVFTRAALERAHREAVAPLEREHVTLHIHRWHERPATGPFRVGHVRGPADFSHLRFTVDEPEDLAFASSVYERLGAAGDFGWLDVVALVTREPSLLALNARFTRNEKFLRELEGAQP